MPAENEEEGFVVRDRRRSMMDAPPADAAPVVRQTPPAPPLPAEPSAPLSAPVVSASDRAGGSLNDGGGFDMAAFMDNNGEPYSPEDMRAALAAAYEAASPEERAEIEAALADAAAQGGMGGPGGAQEIPDIYSILALFLSEIRNIAWLRMGLVANPATGQIERDMDQAKVAIDTISFLADQLEPVVAPEERLPLQAMVADLKQNYVKQSGN